MNFIDLEKGYFVGLWQGKKKSFNVLWIGVVCVLKMVRL